MTNRIGFYDNMVDRIANEGRSSAIMEGRINDSIKWNDVNYQQVFYKYQSEKYPDRKEFLAKQLENIFEIGMELLNKKLGVEK